MRSFWAVACGLVAVAWKSHKWQAAFLRLFEEHYCLSKNSCSFRCLLFQGFLEKLPQFPLQWNFHCQTESHRSFDPFPFWAFCLAKFKALWQCGKKQHFDIWYVIICDIYFFAIYLYMYIFNAYIILVTPQPAGLSQEPTWCRDVDPCQRNSHPLGRHSYVGGCHVCQENDAKCESCDSCNKCDFATWSNTKLKPVFGGEFSHFWTLVIWVKRISMDVFVGVDEWAWPAYETWVGGDLMITS